MVEYFKDFDKWNDIKKNVDSKSLPAEFFFGEKEIWWCQLGVNIGSEQDGKNPSFERPALIIRKISKDLVYIIPLTSKIKSEKLRVNLVCAGIQSQLLIFQAKIISTKRLSRRIGYVKKDIFHKSLLTLIKMIVGNLGETPL